MDMLILGGLFLVGIATLFERRAENARTTRARVAALLMMLALVTPGALMLFVSWDRISNENEQERKCMQLRDSGLGDYGCP
jgi:hypothetical protein